MSTPTPTKWTAGEWAVNPEEPLEIRGNNGEGVLIAVAYYTKSLCSEQQAETNALLLAASKRLYEALVEARDHLYTKQDMDRVRELARAALNAADGGKGER